MKILTLHGPNLNMLGLREPEIYGASTLADIDEMVKQIGRELDVEVECFQSNSEAELIERVQEGRDSYDGVLINPAAFTHTSVGLRDALAAVALPFVEVHLSNVHAREPFRKNSYFSDLAVGVVAGFGARSYEMGLRGLVDALKGAG